MATSPADRFRPPTTTLQPVCTPQEVPQPPFRPPTTAFTATVAAPPPPQLHVLRAPASAPARSRPRPTPCHLPLAPGPAAAAALSQHTPRSPPPPLCDQVLQSLSDTTPSLTPDAHAPMPQDRPSTIAFPEEHSELQLAPTSETPPSPPAATRARAWETWVGLGLGLAVLVAALIVRLALSLSSAAPPECQAGSLDLMFPAHTLGPNRTSYMCAGLSLPTDCTMYVHRIEPILGINEVHHIVAFKAVNNLGACPFSCYDMPQVVRLDGICLRLRCTPPPPTPHPRRGQLPTAVWTRHRAAKQGQSGGSVGTTAQGK